MHELLPSPPGAPTWQHRALLVPLFAGSTCDSRNRTEAVKCLRALINPGGFFRGGDHGAVDRDVLKGGKVQLLLLLHSTIGSTSKRAEKDRRGILSDRALTESIAEIQNCSFKSAVKKCCVGLSKSVPQLLLWKNTVCLHWFMLTVVLPVSLAVYVECPALPAAPAPPVSVLPHGDVCLPVWSVFFRCSLQTRRGWKKH